jgi:hypothetical protein
MEKQNPPRIFNYHFKSKYFFLKFLGTGYWPREHKTVKSFLMEPEGTLANQNGFYPNVVAVPSARVIPLVKQMGPKGAQGGPKGAQMIKFMEMIVKLIELI